MQKWKEKVHHMICGPADIMDSKRNSLFISLSTVTEELKQVPEER